MSGLKWMMLGAELLLLASCAGRPAGSPSPAEGSAPPKLVSTEELARWQATRPVVLIFHAIENKGTRSGSVDTAGLHINGTNLTSNTIRDYR